MPDGELGLAPRERKELKDRVRSRTLPAEDVRRARPDSAVGARQVLLRDSPPARLQSQLISKSPAETIELQENRVIVNGRGIPVRALNPADFAWVPKGHPIRICSA
jgi:hypothetical protein